MNRFYRAVKLTLLIVALRTWFLAPIASAQTQTPRKTTAPEPKDLDSDEGWHVGFTPYIPEFQVKNIHYISFVPSEALG
jgi:hypothetical protein